MNEYLYHGTIYSGLTELEARSKLHNTDQQVVYLTDNIPYALLYIWDENHNGCGEKHVTGWVRNGVAYYEEQFPDQLKTFYKGVSGYLYAIKKDAQFQMLENREGIHYSFQNAVIIKPNIFRISTKNLSNTKDWENSRCSITMNRQNSAKKNWSICYQIIFWRTISLEAMTRKQRL